MTNQIVQVNVSQQLAAAPSKLQRTGAMISMGGTNTAQYTLSLLTQLSDLTPLLAAAKAISGITWSSSGGGTATLTTAAPHGWTTSETVPIVVSGAVPAGYNGTFAGTVTGASTITYPLAIDPGSETTPGFVQLADESELLAMATTFFTQGGSTAVYVLELGEGTVADAVTALTTWLTANPGTVYSFLVPREWDTNSGFLSLIAAYEGLTAKTYFFVTTTTGTYTTYTALMKNVFAMVEAPGTPATEFSCAAAWWNTLNWDPGSTNKVTPLFASFLFGVTPYPTKGNAALLASLKAANINYVATGSEGGISDAILLWGHSLDGNPFNYWYSVDWAQINIELELANAIINGSNTPLAPLVYDQQGINVLQDRAVQTLQRGITYGLAIGTLKATQLPGPVFAQNYQDGLYKGMLVVNAEPFLVYTTENPNDYSIGKYGGLAAVYTPARPFEQIIFDLTAVNFV